MLKKILLGLLLLTVIVPLLAQISSGGQPYFYNNNLILKSFSDIPEIKLEVGEIDTAPIQESNFKTFVFAQGIDTDISPRNNGVWTEVPGVGKIWQIKIRSFQAFSLGVLFEKFYLPIGAKLFVYNPETNFILGAFTNKNNKEFGSLMVSPVKGDYIIIELQLPYEMETNYSLRVGKVFHDFMGILKNNPNFGEAGACNVDINCFEADKWEEEKRSVCRIIFPVGFELVAGSGVLVNNVRNDGTPYFLTANHVFENNDIANNSIFYFNYEHSLCPDEEDNNDAVGGVYTQTISGSELLATSDDIDFSLVKLSETPPIDFLPYYVGWNVNATPPHFLTGIHHPAAKEKKISRDRDRATYSENFSLILGFIENSHWHILNWEEGVTEGGSSGSPLFNNNRKLVGVLSGGAANCENPSDDYYTRLDMAWNYFPEENRQLKIWLDPDNKNITTIEGYDPYEHEEIYFRWFNFNYTDYYSTYNSSNYNSLAEKFQLQGKIRGIYFLPNKVEIANGNTIEIKIWEGDKYPENLIYTQEVDLSLFEENVESLIYLDNAVEFENQLFVGFQTQNNNFGVYKISKTKGISNSAFAYSQNKWDYLSVSEGDDISLSLGVRLLASSEDKIVIPDIEYGDVLFYPNPITDFLYLGLENMPQEFKVFIYDTSGALIAVDNEAKEKLEPKYDRYHKYIMPFEKYKKGIYIIKVKMDNQIVAKKIIKN